MRKQLFVSFDNGLNMSVCPSACLSTHKLCHGPHGSDWFEFSTYDADFFTIWHPQHSSFLARNFVTHSNGMTFKFKVKYKRSRQKCDFQH